MLASICLAFLNKIIYHEVLGGLSFFHGHSKVPGERMKRTFLLATIITASLFSGKIAISQEASIEGLTVALNGQMEVSFSVINCCTEKMEEAIQSGVPTTLTFRVKVYRVRSLWPDKKMTSVAFIHSIK